MEADKKDKLIIALIIGIVIILSRNFINNQKKDELVFDNASSSVSIESNQLSNKETKEKIENNNNTTMKVHISGEINKAGVYDIKENYRLEDLVKDAGGLTNNADINRINLAMKLEDQMHVIIPNKNDQENNQTQDQLVTPVDTNQNKKININNADKNSLMTLPNIGEKRAEAIIEYRQKNKFNKIDDIKNVSGIGDKYFEAMKDMIVVD
ncbi:helix-hairpin-helix domain-containing protein [Anaerococcus hydrogenalis]|uniref:helix-hairpin-helix domain-containing protein n=1 Tax=Anaerococcus hydrogenalis TaxID=33029 RepID=UPI0023F085C5|nr:helix-hairpin-helix domain-containing protein [Anaerococcus hydrogenalis]